MKQFICQTLAWSLLLLVCSFPALGQAPLPPELRKDIEQIDALTTAAYDRDKRGGISVGVIFESKLVWTKSYGYADAENKVQATRNTVYRIGSITKMFTALMLLQLVEEGKVRFYDPVEKYFPEINQVQGRFTGAPPVTLLQLATHTSGLDREPDDPATYQTGGVADWEKILVRALPHTKFIYEPGWRYHYSNIGYAILGAALSRAAGQRYTDYVTRKIFMPLGMARTAFEPDARIKTNLARGYWITNGEVDTGTPEREQQGRGYRVPNGAAYSTVEDMARFVSFELGEEKAAVLKKESLQNSFMRGEMMSSDLTSGYGLGFEVFRRGNVVMFGHGGAVAGYESGALFEPKSRSGIIVLRNVLGGDFNIGELCMRSVEILATGQVSDK